MGYSAGRSRSHKRKSADAELLSLRQAPGQLGLVLLALAFFAFVMGGGGSRYALANLLVQIAALGAMAFAIPDFRKSLGDMPRGLLLLVVCSFLLPLLQIVPLPPALWQALPGRELVAESLELIGQSAAWFPLSVDYGRTLVAMASLVPVLAILLLYPWGKEGAAEAALLLIVVLGWLNFAFGALQLFAPQNALNPYPVRDGGRLYGFFANHNSSGLFFVIALCAAIGAARSSLATPALRPFFWGSGAIFALGAVLTNSRSSTALLLLPLALAGWIGWKKLARFGGKVRMAVAAAAVVSLGAMALLFTQNSRLGATASRFATLEDHRPEIWTDSLVSIERFFPFGSGLGTFRDVFPVDESLEYVLAGQAGRAHNDYLEIAIEAGIFGLLLVAAWGLWLAIKVFAARNDKHWPVVQAAAIGFLCIAAQSLIDYPLRNQAMLCIAGLLIAVMVGREPAKRDRNAT